MLSRIRRLFRYDEWANRQSLASAAPPRARTLMAHVLGTEWLWLSRARREPSPVPVWPAWSAAECAAQADAVPRARQVKLRHGCAGGVSAASRPSS